MDILSVLEDSRPTEIKDSVIREFYDNRTLLINGEISDWILEEIILSILLWNKDDKDIPVDKRQPIRLFIDSVGGEVFSANNLIDVIRTSKTPVIAIGFSLVASCALSIYCACHIRYAFKHTIFNMHEGRSGCYDHSNKVRDFMDFLDKIDELDKQRILEYTNITEEEFDSKKRLEQFFFAEEARDKNIVDKIIGEDECVIDDIL